MLTVNRLSLEEARALVEGAEKKSAAMGIPMSIAITDESGFLIAFTRMDTGRTHSIDIALKKAWTAAVTRRETAYYNSVCVPGQLTFGIHVSNEGRFTVIGGGLPVIVDGQTIGAIGVSGGSAEQDIEVCEAALAHLKAKLGK